MTGGLTSDPSPEPDPDPEPEPPAPERARRRSLPVVWKRTWVDDRPAFYGLAGEGMPVVLLHGWALGHHTYRAVIGRIAAQGCQSWVAAHPTGAEARASDS